MRLFYVNVAKISAFALLSVAFLGCLALSGCESEITVNIPGCEDCPDRCLRESGVNSGKCVDCINDDNCRSDGSPTKKCLDNKCVCGSPKDCPDGQFCAAGGKGKGGCVDCIQDSQCKDSEKPVCQFNECVQCRPGEQEKCAPKGVTPCKQGLRKCKSNGSWDTCEGWSECKDGQKCVANECVADCPNEPCSKEAKTCTSQPDEVPGTFKECKKNAKGCFEQNDGTCGAKEFCDKGACQPYTCPKAECTLDETKCVDPLHARTCEKDANGCLKWSDKQKCKEGLTCTLVTNSCGCPKAECKLDETQCIDQNSFRICEKDANGCLKWSESKACAPDSKCTLATKRCTVCVPGETRACYSGPNGTQGKGPCKGGTQKCEADGSKWGVCAGELLPGAETCNGKDDDCDGTIDNNLKPELCAIQRDLCKGSVKQCKGAQGWASCTESDYRKLFPGYQFNETKCDGIDNDCDGKVDNTTTGCNCQDGATQPCGTNLGICSVGTQICSSGKWGKCSGISKESNSETLCDGRDEDCDGKVDENWTDKGKSCEAGRRGTPCFRTGKYVCRSDKKDTYCNAAKVSGTSEVCNGKDDDCDGRTDEGLNYVQCGRGKECKNGRCSTCSQPGNSHCPKDIFGGCDRGALPISGCKCGYVSRCQQTTTNLNLGCNAGCCVYQKCVKP